MLTPPNRLEYTEQTSDQTLNAAATARLHDASYDNASLADWHRASGTERNSSLTFDNNIYPSANGSERAKVQPTADLMPAGGVPIREAMMSILNIADQLRASDTMTPEQRNTLLGALTDFDQAKTACLDNGAWQELRFINGVSSAVSTFVGRRGLANGAGGSESLSDSTIASGAGLTLSSGALQSGFLPGVEPAQDLVPAPRKEVADSSGGTVSQNGPRLDDQAGLESYRYNRQASDMVSSLGRQTPSDGALEVPLSTGDGKRISMGSRGRAEDSSNLGMTS